MKGALIGGAITEEGHRHSVSIWTSLLQPETAEVRISLPKAPAGLAGDEKIADFTLQAVDTDQLPVRLNALLQARPDGGGELASACLRIDVDHAQRLAMHLHQGDHAVVTLAACRRRQTGLLGDE